MTEPWMNLDSAGFAAVCAGHLIYVAWLAARSRAERPLSAATALYLLAVACTGLWGLMALVDLASTKLWTWHAAEQLDQMRYAFWCSFLLSLTRPAGAPAPTLRWVLPLAALAVGGAIVNAWSGFGAAQEAQIARWLAAVHLAWPILTAALIEQVYRNQADHYRWGAKPLCLGVGALCAYDIFLYSEAMMFGRPDADVLAARGIVHAVTIVLLVTASQRHSAWIGRIRISKAAAFYSASLLLIGLYLSGAAAIGYYVRYFGGTWGGVAQVALAFASLVALSVLVLSGSTRARLRVFLGKNFFRYRYDYRHEWLRFTNMLSTRSSPQEVGVLVTRGLADMVESPGGSLWFKALGDDDFVQSARWNMPELTAREAPGSAFCSFMRDHEWIVDLRSPADGQSNGSTPPQAPAWLAQVEDAWLVLPLLVADDMLGFVVLVKPRTPLALNWEVRDLLKTAARQAAGFLAQMHATEALLEARKFDAFNRMSAFVVHDLKNIVTQLSLMLKNAERHRDNPEFRADMLLTVESSLDKMRQLMLQLREGAKPAGVASGVELKPVLQRIEQMALQRGRAIELDIADRVATRGDENRLERVIGHVVQNALDATSSSGRVWATLRQSAGRAMLVVGDTGVGMSQEFIQTRLFRPFSSTKASGMGIGSYESFQYIRELGGSIDVKSEPGQGSVITIYLPLFDLRVETDLRVRGAA